MRAAMIHSAIVTGLTIIVSLASWQEANARCRPIKPNGCFIGKLLFKEGWPAQNSNARLRTVSSNFSYVDPLGRQWDIKPGFETDGASIPRIFRPVIGGPWTYVFVRAAVVHDSLIRSYCLIGGRCTSHLLLCAACRRHTKRSRAADVQCGQVFWTVLGCPGWQSVAQNRLQPTPQIRTKPACSGAVHEKIQ